MLSKTRQSSTPFFIVCVYVYVCVCVSDSWTLAQCECTICKLFPLILQLPLSQGEQSHSGMRFLPGLILLEHIGSGNYATTFLKFTMI